MMVTDQWKGYPNVDWKGYSDVSLKRLLWRVTKKATLTSTEKATLVSHWKHYDDGDRSLQRLPWCITEKATLTSTENTTLTCHWKGSVCHQIIYSSQWLNMHLHSCLLQLTIAMSLYKDMPSKNASSNFTHTLSLHSRTILFNMPSYLLPAWNERPFFHSQWQAKMTISLVPTTYGMTCWVCPNTDPSGYIGYYISIS
jgi:hypothetical protein